MSVSSRVSVEEYLAADWPPNSQLIDGEMVVNDPALRHQLAAGAILGELRSWCLADQGRGLAGLGCNWVIPVGANVYKPDVWWLAEHHVPPDDTVWLRRVPDLAVEVRSPGTWRHDTGIKLQVYEAAGLPELWLVDPEDQTFRVLRRSSPTSGRFDVEARWTAASGDEARSPQLPGCAIPLARLFR
ncbi:MAG TPA: Uma2 family endonuclease [Acidimicrobiales bacterium]|jgi:Uma2 family endonuclease